MSEALRLSQGLPSTSGYMFEDLPKPTLIPLDMQTTPTDLNSFPELSAGLRRGIEHTIRTTDGWIIGQDGLPAVKYNGEQYVWNTYSMPVAGVAQYPRQGSIPFVSRSVKKHTGNVERYAMGATFNIQEIHGYKVEEQGLFLLRMVIEQLVAVALETIAYKVMRTFMAVTNHVLIAMKQNGKFTTWGIVDWMNYQKLTFGAASFGDASYVYMLNRLKQHRVDLKLFNLTHIIMHPNTRQMLATDRTNHFQDGDRGVTRLYDGPERITKYQENVVNVAYSYRQQYNRQSEQVLEHEVRLGEFYQSWQPGNQVRRLQGSDYILIYDENANAFSPIKLNDMINNALNLWETGNPDNYGPDGQWTPGSGASETDWDRTVRNLIFTANHKNLESHKITGLKPTDWFSDPILNCRLTTRDGGVINSPAELKDVLLEEAKWDTTKPDSTGTGGTSTAYTGGSITGSSSTGTGSSSTGTGSTGFYTSSQDRATTGRPWNAHVLKMQAESHGSGNEIAKWNARHQSIGTSGTAAVFILVRDNIHRVMGTDVWYRKEPGRTLLGDFESMTSGDSSNHMLEFTQIFKFGTYIETAEAVHHLKNTVYVDYIGGKDVTWLKGETGCHKFKSWLRDNGVSRGGFPRESMWSWLVSVDGYANKSEKYDDVTVLDNSYFSLLGDYSKGGAQITQTRESKVHINGGIIPGFDYMYKLLGLNVMRQRLNSRRELSVAEPMATIMCRGTVMGVHNTRDASSNTITAVSEWTSGSSSFDNGDEKNIVEVRKGQHPRPARVLTETVMLGKM
jgi:hypothetical protein